MGISTASATMLSIVASNRLMTGGGENGGEQVDEQPGEARRRDLAHAVAEALVADAGEQLGVLVDLLLDHLDDVVDGDDANEALVLVDDRRCHEAVAFELARHRLLVGRRQHDVAVGVHDRIDFDVALGAQQARKVDAAEQVKTGIDDENLRERLRQILGFAREVDDLLHRPERRHGDEVRLHQAARGLLGIEQVALQGGALALRHLVEDFLLVVRLEAFEKVGRVVAVELADAAREDVVRQRLGELIADLFVDLGEHLEIEIGSQRLDEADALLGLEHFDEVGKIGIFDVRYQRTHLRRIVFLQRLGDRAHQLGGRRRLGLVRSDLLGLGHGQAHSEGGRRRGAPPGKDELHHARDALA